MTLHTGPLSSRLARAWRAVVRAFTPDGGVSGSHSANADTTLFGGLPELDRPTARGDSGRNGRWDPASETTDFAEPDLEVQPRRAER